MSEVVKKIQNAVGATPDGIWGHNTMTAVAKALKCEANPRVIQMVVGATVDGIIGERTLAKIAEKVCKTSTTSTPSGKVDVFLDPGHTADYGREHPSQFTGVEWEVGKGKRIADILGFTRSTKDSIEHMLNVKLVNSIAKHLKVLGLTYFIYDDPSLSNNAEIGQVYRKSNAMKPRCFVSVHNNAAGANGWKGMSCSASGSVGCYKGGRSNCKKLTEVITDKMVAYRKANGGPDNRASHLSQISVGVLTNASADIPATLLEVCFYDNMTDLLWTCEHIDGMGKAIADGIKQYLG